MKKIYIVFIVGLTILGTVIGFYFYNAKINNHQNSGDTNSFPYNATKVSTSNNTNSSSEHNENINNNSDNTSNENKEHIETEIAEFTTKIYTKDKERQNNINITCTSLNDTFINDGETFSFTKIVGKATSSKGYKKADVFKDGEVVKALGGGNCQVSSTLYNAVLKVPELEVIERHEHSNSVPYVSKGKDAAVAYGSYDFKFINKLGTQIKISASCDKDYVYIKLFKIE